MKFETEKNIIEPLILKASRLANKHLTLPVLSCVFLEVLNENKLIIKSTNLDVGVEIETKIKTISSGNIAVPASILINTLSSIKEKNITFESVDNNLKISTKNNNVLIKCMQSEDFPSIPKIKNDNILKINYKDLLIGFKSVWYSASVSSIKPELGSVFVYNNGSGLVFVSTDSFRLAEKTINTKSYSEFPQTLIPYKNVSEIVKIFEDIEGDMSIIFDKNQVAFFVDNVYVVSRLIDGSFPDYKQIIPKNFVATATILKNDLINAIKTSNIFSDNLNQIKFKIDSKNKVLIIESKNNDIGEYKESIKASVSGEDIDLNFNNKYISDCMQSIPSESITLSFGGIGKPLIINSASDKSFMYIVMPMNR